MSGIGSWDQETPDKEKIGRSKEGHEISLKNKIHLKYSRHIKKLKGSWGTE